MVCNTFHRYTYHVYNFFFSPSSPSQGRSVYNFPRITKQDEGSYICKGQSLAGDIEELVQIIVLEVLFIYLFFKCFILLFFVNFSDMIRMMLLLIMEGLDIVRRVLNMEGLIIVQIMTILLMMKTPML